MKLWTAAGPWRSRPIPKARPTARRCCAWRSMLFAYTAAAGVATVTLNRPDKRNAITSEMMSAMREALQRASHDSAIRLVLIRGAGKDFCAGLDLTEVLKSAEDHQASIASARRLGDLYIAMRRHPKPIVAAVQGRALGGGAG